MRLLDPSFKYLPAAQTDVAATWRRFGFRPTTETERRSRNTRGDDAPVADPRSAGTVLQQGRRADRRVSE